MKKFRCDNLNCRLCVLTEKLEVVQENQDAARSVNHLGAAVLALKSLRPKARAMGKAKRPR